MHFLFTVAILVGLTMATTNNMTSPPTAPQPSGFDPSLGSATAVNASATASSANTVPGFMKDGKCVCSVPPPCNSGNTPTTSSPKPDSSDPTPPGSSTPSTPSHPTTPTNPANPNSPTNPTTGGNNGTQNGTTNGGGDTNSTSSAISMSDKAPYLTGLVSLAMAALVA